jgi:hypothetical protein
MANGLTYKSRLLYRLERFGEQLNRSNKQSVK